MAVVPSTSNTLTMKCRFIHNTSILLYKELERTIRMRNIGMNVDKVLEKAKTITTLWIQLPNGELYTETLYTIPQQEAIRALIGPEFLQGCIVEVRKLFFVFQRLIANHFLLENVVAYLHLLLTYCFFEISKSSIYKCTTIQTEITLFT